jgi:hypothetical protein
MAKKVIELMGGSIQLESELKCGTSIIIVLPIEEAPPPKIITKNENKNMLLNLKGTAVLYPIY